MRSKFFTFSFIFFSVKNVFFSKNIFQYKTVFPYKDIFSANNVYFVKNTNIFPKKNFFFNLVLQQMNNHNWETNSKFGFENSNANISQFYIPIMFRATHHI